MTAKAPAREVGRILVDQLAIHGLETSLAGPGESCLPAIEGLRARAFARRRG